MLRAGAITSHIYPELSANEIQITYDNLASQSVLIKEKRHQNTHSSVKYEVIKKCKITLPNMKY